MIKIARLVWSWSMRLPWKLTIPFVLSLVVSLSIVAMVFQSFGVSEVADAVARLIGVEFLFASEATGISAYAGTVVRAVFEGLVSLTVVLLAVLFSYNVAAIVYRHARSRPVGDIYVHSPAPPASGSESAIRAFKERNGVEELRVGLILAGGGAKGAYQAGAMKAIHEFLEANNALSSVRMIAGTSIGSWNSMFWLAGLVKPPGPNAQSAHERWWRSISIAGVMEFAQFLPLRNNYFLESTPWREAFRRIFVEQASVNETLSRLFESGPDDSRMHFYFTRSNVESGQLEFGTNNAGLPNQMRKNWRSGLPEPRIPSDQYEVIGPGSQEPMSRLELAVYASMDLPPLLPYLRIRTTREELFEDGGVVDNLPMRYGTDIENCNLLFVLPLNSSFAQKAGESSMTSRLFRVMDIRQGVLERNSLRLARLYNDNVRLKNEIQRLKNPGAPEASLLSVFAICPSAPLSIGTAEFWKPKEAGEAFDLMYSATHTALKDRFLQLTDPDVLTMTLVSPEGELSINDQF